MMTEFVIVCVYEEKRERKLAEGGKANKDGRLRREKVENDCKLEWNEYKQKNNRSE